MKRIIELLDTIITKNDNLTKEWYENGYLLMIGIGMIILFIMVVIL